MSCTNCVQISTASLALFGCCVPIPLLFGSFFFQCHFYEDITWDASAQAAAEDMLLDMIDCAANWDYTKAFNFFTGSGEFMDDACAAIFSGDFAAPWNNDWACADPDSTDHMWSSKGHEFETGYTDVGVWFAHDFMAFMDIKVLDGSNPDVKNVFVTYQRGYIYNVPTQSSVYYGSLGYYNNGQLFSEVHTPPVPAALVSAPVWGSTCDGCSYIDCQQIYELTPDEAGKYIALYPSQSFTWLYNWKPTASCCL